MEWFKTINVLPTKSGIYRVREELCKYAYYSVTADYWEYDDGTWLPIRVLPTSWRKLTEKERKRFYGMDQR